MLTHIILDLADLIDPRRVRAVTANGIQQMMTARYGDADWAAAYRQMMADWASYFADLNFGGENGMADMREGDFRVARALFRLTAMPEPPTAEITQLAADIVSCAIINDVLLPAAHTMLETLLSDYPIVVNSYMREARTRAILQQGGYEERIETIIGAETLERYERDKLYYQLLVRRIGVEARQCIVVEAHWLAAASAESVGMRVIQKERDDLAALYNQLKRVLGERDE